MSEMDMDRREAEIQADVSIIFKEVDGGRDFVNRTTTEMVRLQEDETITGVEIKAVVGER